MKYPKLLMLLVVMAPLTLAFASACTTLTPDYRSYPLADGTVEIEAIDGDKETAARFATDGAEHYCRQKHKEAVYLARPEPVYQGQYDESIVQGVKTAERVVRALGQGDSTTNVSGSLTEHDDYKAKYSIRCQ